MGNYMLTLNNLSSPKGAHRNIKRLGRGQGSGQGKQAGKGHKGQKARAGGGVRTGFEGGAMPLYMRLPKRGFSNAPFKTIYAEVNLAIVEAKFTTEEVTREALVEKGILKGINKRRPIKILGNGELSKSLTFVNIDKFSKSAEEMVSKAGGKIETKK
ncbi:50S ribosomal protein L15 [Halobacteriovorax marinus SJ]|uniref:Large ribosomal subunit protein uL15 n=1 Tax=Halobacteriovorax marinus (strain ATCC BAA-682 / DSM 15412 / SJ) TaxID=862908 RepID=E1X0K3_HALMS|nr:50S ribosomal protein L15 [Halobacteriovorax marinus SJ]